MTHNQIEYWKLQESKRSNVAKETETNRANLASERENERSHRAVEQETRRSNLAREDETHRSNVANEGIKKEANVINNAHYLRTDSENQRHNLASERLTAASQDIEREKTQLGYYNANINKEIGYANVGLGYGNLELGYQNLSEAQRSHLAVETETSTHNRAQEEAGAAQAVSSNVSSRANLQRAQNEANKLSFEREKWNEVGKAEQAARTAATLSGIKTDAYNRAGIFSNIINGHLGSYNNALRSFGNLAQSATKLLPKGQ